MLLTILQLDNSQAKAHIANKDAKDLFMQGKYDLYLRGLFQGVLPKLLHLIGLFNKKFVMNKER
jgi:hypothetical protein